MRWRWLAVALVLSACGSAERPSVTNETTPPTWDPSPECERLMSRVFDAERDGTLTSEQMAHAVDVCAATS